jgi:hypothetical protein
MFRNRSRLENTLTLVVEQYPVGWKLLGLTVQKQVSLSCDPCSAFTGTEGLLGISSDTTLHRVRMDPERSVTTVTAIVVRSTHLFSLTGFAHCVDVCPWDISTADYASLAAIFAEVASSAATETYPSRYIDISVIDPALVFAYRAHCSIWSEPTTDRACSRDAFVIRQLVYFDPNVHERKVGHLFRVVESHFEHFIVVVSLVRSEKQLVCNSWP